MPGLLKAGREDAEGATRAPPPPPKLRPPPLKPPPPKLRPPPPPPKLRPPPPPPRLPPPRCASAPVKASESTNMLLRIIFNFFMLQNFKRYTLKQEVTRLPGGSRLLDL
ncbi:hypothetical protein DCC81_08555 [Chitinophaga parva]|uniref:Uncharacterized protein n=1 Tax=Chitinophaga parva TaxID=2169414 RepID=A0A2T7BP77_9BACT|nr:hypothetical protein DCC81_08555 [Chitinophaga parva]